jgi:hypothetical protein
MAAEKLDDKPTVYLLSETPDTVDKPVFDFSRVSYTDGRTMNTVMVQVQKKNKALTDAQNAESFEDLVDQLESLTRDQKTHQAAHGHENKILAIRIRRIETRLENWVDVDIDIEALAKEVNVLMDQQEKFILSGVTYIPQGWLTSDAPLASKIDWADHNNLRYLRADKFPTLSRAKRAAQDDSPN